MYCNVDNIIIMLFLRWWMLVFMRLVILYIVGHDTIEEEDRHWLSNAHITRSI